MKKVLITAGPVYGSLDANKLVSNRIRGIWAVKFGHYLVRRGHQVTLLVADTFQHQPSIGIEVVRHKGFHDYMEKCGELAKTHDSAVMAAAVVNWIPKEPYPTKMPTAGFKEGDVIEVPFYLAPRVINRMKIANPKLTLIGCKMLVNATHEDLIEAAYHVLLSARCNLVIANDMGRGLKTKYLIHKDRAVVTHQDDWNGFYADILAVIEDEYYESRVVVPTPEGHAEHLKTFCEQYELFDRIVEENRDRFFKPVDGEDRAFGAVAVKLPGLGWLCSPREKSGMFTSKDAVVVLGWVEDERGFVGQTGCRPLVVVNSMTKSKATLNAPLLIRVGEEHKAKAVLHLHEQLPAFGGRCIVPPPTVKHAPPGTVRDNNRIIPGPEFNIEGHGFIKCL